MRRASTPRAVPVPAAQVSPSATLPSGLGLSPDAPGGRNAYSVPTLSSPKQTSPLLNTPQTVTVIPQAIIREQGARDLTEVLRNTPGISFNAGENGFGTGTDNFQIRGFDSSGSVYVDGTRSNGVFRRDMFNVDRVEVIKGPSADNGRGGPGGYVNIVTKLPTLENFVAGDVTLGASDRRSGMQTRGTFDVNQTIAPGVAFRLNGVLESSPVSGRDLAETRPAGLAPSLAFGLGTDLRVYLSYEMQRRRDRPDWGVPGASIPGMINFDPVAGRAKRNAYYGLRTDFDDADSDTAMGRVEYDIAKGVTLSNQTTWSHVDRKSRFTAPTGYTAATQMVPTQTWFYDRNTTTISNLTNLSAEFHTWGLKHNLSTGIDITNEESKANRFGSSNPGATWVFGPNPDRGFAAPFNPTEDNSVRINTVAAYLYDTITLNRQWQLVGGIRGEHYDVKIGSHSLVTGLPTGISGYKESDFTVSGKVGVVYKPVEEGTLYASFGVSHLPPGSYLSNPDISRTGENAFPGFIQGADPVRAINYEIGAKWDFFDKRLTTTAALFRTEKRVAISGADSIGGPVGLKGYGEQIVQGLELGVAGQVTEDWKVFGGLSWIHSERRHSAYLDRVRYNANPGDYGNDPFVRTSGDSLAFTPEFTANLWTTYRLPYNVTIGGGVQYVGESWLGRPDDALRIIPNGRFGKLPDYFLANVMASYEVQKDVHIRLNVDNLFDEKYAMSSNWNGSRAQLGLSRTYRISTSFRF
ncbi:catecholate siderophore receptor [Enterovirga rhinocerotis]|uniref:Catecholate siderophore receptor n=1 Tax=Enterovirga rhinocerotis TaxID=1339210 RepID=A0A4R7BMI9_9HYPH|nr:catecholate siderophore receptor [Enterovirga rhinocerotis]